MKRSLPVDVVITWVDGSDPDWFKERAKWMPMELAEKKEHDVSVQKGTSEVRFRDWGLLKYLFRGIEKNMPWIHRVFLVVWGGNLPEWLDTRCRRLKIVKHGDYIPSKYLPTFSAHTIELNFHRIRELSERFIYFNDDVFPIKRIPRSYYFSREGIPRDYAIMNARSIEYDDQFFIPVMDDSIINKHYNKMDVIRRHPTKWFHPSYGIYNTLNLIFTKWTNFTGFVDGHLALPYTKTQFERLWRVEEGLLDSICMNKFRSNHDINQWLVRYMRLCDGDFVPKRVEPLDALFSFEMGGTEMALRCVNAIREKKFPVICINDGERMGDFGQVRNRIEDAFLEIFPDKSIFEK